MAFEPAKERSCFSLPPIIAVGRGAAPQFSPRASAIFLASQLPVNIAPMEPSEDMEEILTESTPVALEKNQFTAYEIEMTKEISDVPEDLRDEVALSLGHLAPNLAEYEKAAAEQREENSDYAYEKMVMLQKGKNSNDISDVDLFG